MSTTTYHLRPRRGWLNDPNGMVYRDGRWHVFFQHNPQAPRHDRICWGHASSSDLIRWDEHPVAFGPTPDGPDSFGCWSGVYVAGLDHPAVVYSGVTDAAGSSTVCLRWGADDLMTWSEPVVVAELPSVDGVRVMRDPFVFDHGGRRWALLGAGLGDGCPAAILYSCDDIVQWRYEGVFASARDAGLSSAGPADVWECAQLARLPDGSAALVLSLHDRGVLGQVVGCLGRIVTDGAGRPRFEAVRGSDAVQVLDGGNSYYAPQVAQDPDGGWVMGWVREEAQDAADHAGCMTLPRRLVLEGQRLRLVLDPRLRSGLALGPPETIADGAELFGAWQIVAAGPGVGLFHDTFGALDLAAGTEVWGDGTVVEVYPTGGAPSTWRHDRPWRLRGPAGGLRLRRVLCGGQPAGSDTP